MDYGKLIERLTADAKDWAGDGYIKRDLQDAATAIEGLRAELARVTAERDGAKSPEVLEAVDEKVEFARTRMRIAEWLYYVDVLGEWRGDDIVVEQSWVAKRVFRAPRGRRTDHEAADNVV